MTIDQFNNLKKSFFFSVYQFLGDVGAAVNRWGRKTWVFQHTKVLVAFTGGYSYDFKLKDKTFFVCFQIETNALINCSQEDA